MSDDGSRVNRNPLNELDFWLGRESALPPPVKGEGGFGLQLILGVALAAGALAERRAEDVAE